MNLSERRGRDEDSRSDSYNLFGAGGTGHRLCGTTAALYVTQPASKTTTTIRFVVNSGDSTTTVGDHLQADGLVRSALAFKLYVNSATTYSGRYLPPQSHDDHGQDRQRPSERASP